MEVANKPDENYFTRNFDECMKRLQIIEKEQEIMEADAGRTLNVYNLKKPLKRQMTPPAGECAVPPPEKEASQQKTKEDEQEEIDRKTPAVTETPENGEGSEENPLQIDAWKESEAKLSGEYFNHVNQTRYKINSYIYIWCDYFWQIWRVFHCTRINKWYSQWRILQND